MFGRLQRQAANTHRCPYPAPKPARQQNSSLFKAYYQLQQQGRLRSASQSASPILDQCGHQGRAAVATRLNRPNRLLHTCSCHAGQRCPAHRKASRIHRCPVLQLQVRMHGQQAGAATTEAEAELELAESHLPQPSQLHRRPESSSAPFQSESVGESAPVEAGSDRALDQHAEANSPTESALRHIEVPAKLKRSKASSVAEPYSQHGGVFYPPAGTARAMLLEWRSAVPWLRAGFRSPSKGVPGSAQLTCS